MRIIPVSLALAMLAINVMESKGTTKHMSIPHIS